jgi:hypothetical protein
MMLQAGEQEATPVRAVQRVAVIVAPHRERHFPLPGLGPFPEDVVDDAEIGDLDHFPVLARVGASHPPAGPRILHVGAAVPLQPAGVERVVEEAGGPLGLAADGGVAPAPAPWSRHALPVQQLGDRPR